ncbi:CLUMA_CG003532, isoform A [Clunio marinus]|uniref:CLUMA_CG003532, isoform A n=1 Tax=Clunio marinus TaxID=568069 RepID=A0A1J1HP89_9DIPT|nr:CLUMA_CG003532, isoform A [Clunio marinus]
MYKANKKLFQFQANKRGRNFHRRVVVDLRHTGFERNRCEVRMKLKTPYAAIFKKNTDGVIWDVLGFLTHCPCGNAGNERLNTIQGEILVAERKLEGLEARIKAA